MVQIVLFACRSFVRNLEFGGTRFFSLELFVPFSYIVYCANLHSFPDSLASYCDRQRHVSKLCKETGIHRVRETSAIYSVSLRQSTYSNISTSGTYILDNIHQRVKWPWQATNTFIVLSRIRQLTDTLSIYYSIVKHIDMCIKLGLHVYPAAIVTFTRVLVKLITINCVLTLRAPLKERRPSSYVSIAEIWLSRVSENHASFQLAWAIRHPRAIFDVLHDVIPDLIKSFQQIDSKIQDFNVKCTSLINGYTLK